VSVVPGISRTRPSLIRVALLTAAFVGALAGAATLALHLQLDPLADVRAYYDAAERLNAGQPLYPVDADVDAAAYYRYPPLLAILFRPLALLPYEAAAALWELALVAALLATLYRLGIRYRWTWWLFFILSPAIAWTMSIGQAQAIVTLLTAIAAPWSIALAAHVKLFPALVAVYWLGRRDWRRLRSFVEWAALLALVQAALEPVNSMVFVTKTSLADVGNVANLSPYSSSPALWGALLVVGGAAAWRLAPSRVGWMAAVTLSVLATPRLLLYMLGSLLAGIARPAGASNDAAGTTTR
jgi:Glycosyltransferase family 87